MSCEKFEPFLSAYVDEELPTEQHSALEGHLEGCTRCDSLLLAFRQMQRGLALDIEPDPFFLTRFRAARDADRLASNVWRRWSVRLIPVAVASFLAAVFAIWSAVSDPMPYDAAAEELNFGFSAAAEQAAVSDPVLAIAFEPLPIMPVAVDGEP